MGRSVKIGDAGLPAFASDVTPYTPECATLTARRARRGWSPLGDAPRGRPTGAQAGVPVASESEATLTLIQPAQGFADKPHYVKSL